MEKEEIEKLAHIHAEETDEFNGNYTNRTKRDSFIAGFEACQELTINPNKITNRKPLKAE